MRKWQNLRPNHSTRAPAVHVFLDTETCGDKIDSGGKYGIHRLRLGCATSVRWEKGRFTRRKDIVFTDADSFWVWLSKHLDKKRPTWLWAHNAGFDLTATRFWELIENESYVPRLMVIDSPPTIIRGKLDGKSLTIVDTLNWYRFSLEELGKQFGLPKMRFPDFAEPDEVWLAYCKNDVEIILNVVYSIISFCREQDLGCLRTTAPGQSLQTFRHWCPDVLPSIHANEEAAQLERRAYYGGQTQVYYVGKVRNGRDYVPGLGPCPEEFGRDGCVGPIAHLDVRSLYPFVMRTNPFPCRLKSVGRNLTVHELEALALVDGVIADVEVSTSRHTYPVRIGKQTTFAFGRFRTSLAGPELIRALRSGHVISVGIVASYDLRIMFRKYVDRLWELRCKNASEGNDAMDSVCKCLLNSLYGKFAQRIGEWVDDKSIEPPIPWGQWQEECPATGQPLTYRSIGGNAQRKGDEEDSPHTFVAISAYCTAYAREYMRMLRSVAGQQQVLYQHTDSLHCLPQGYQRLIESGYVDGEVLGKLRLVELGDEGEYWGVNHYRIGSKWVRPGIRRDAKQISETVFVQNEFRSLEQTLSKRPEAGVEVREVLKNVHTFRPLGHIRPDGWVIPPCLSEDKNEKLASDSPVPQTVPEGMVSVPVSSGGA